MADIKITILNCYEQWRSNSSSLHVQSQHPPASNSSPQASILRRSVYSHETNTLSPFSTRSSPWARVSILSRSRKLPPYGQSPHEGDKLKVQRESSDAILRVPRPHEEANSADGARSEQHDTREEEGLRRITEQPRSEQDSASLSASVPVPSGSIQYPSISTSAPAYSGPIDADLQMPLESPTRCALKHIATHVF